MSELKPCKKIYSENETPWDGDLSVIPENGTLVAIDTASSGLVNHVVSGYKITYYSDKPQIRISVRLHGSSTYNERFLEQLEPPLTIREKSILKSAGDKDE